MSPDRGSIAGVRPAVRRVWQRASDRPRSRWEADQERWQARLRMWDLEDLGGYLAALEAQADGPPARHLVWGQIADRRAIVDRDV